MRTPAPRTSVAVLLLALAVPACSSARSGTGTLPPMLGATSPIPRPPHTAADTHFMTGMIPHHAQAIVMAGWAATNAERDNVRILAERIVVSQRDEIELMRSWLRDNGEPVPAADATHVRMTHGGMTHDMLMPGMLTEDELARLQRARGTDFDRLLLTFMIRHHEGALLMVDELFASQGAAQDEFVFKFASDVYADQSSEIHRMKTILDALPPPGGRAP